jgi:hypothetical protein
MQITNASANRTLQVIGQKVESLQEERKTHHRHSNAVQDALSQEVQQLTNKTRVAIETMRSTNGAIQKQSDRVETVVQDFAVFLKEKHS